MNKDDKPMEGDNYVKVSWGVSSAKMTIYGFDDSMEGDKNMKFLPGIKAVTNATDKPYEWDTYFKSNPKANAVINRVTYVQGKPMEGNTYLKGPQWVGAITNYVTNLYDKAMKGDSHGKGTSGFTGVTNLIKAMKKWRRKGIR